jgi:rod shape-determining protein MreB
VETMEVKGRDLIGGVPKTLEINNKEVFDALEEPVSQIVEALRNALERTPPELAADIVDKGIVLAGGGSLLKGLDQRLREETELPIIISEESLTCVVKGAGIVLGELKLLKQISIRD